MGSRRILIAGSVLLFSFGCTGSALNEPDLGFETTIPPSELQCPVDPDCAIGGDCSLYECPEYWVCENLPAGGRRCINPGPLQPEGDRWECEDVDGVTRCRGRDLPDGGAGDSWDCRRDDEFFVCDNDDPRYPDDGGGNEWSCRSEGEFRVCESGGYPDDGGDWDCDVNGGGQLVCRRRPDLPGDGRWECADVDGATTCEGGSGFPDGSGWDCVPNGDGFQCVDRSPDFPGGSGGSGWDCTYDGEFRVCESGGPGDGGGYDSPCPESARASVRFYDDQDGEDDGELSVYGNGRRDQSCATVEVDVSGWYRLYDDALAESCSSQMDEISHVTVQNSCNEDGWPLESNVGPRFVIGDVDNTESCEADRDCDDGYSCQRRSAGFCCVPTAPVLVGTFYLEAGSDNQLCLNHFCADRRAGETRGEHFVNRDCEGSVNSVHLRLDGAAFLCPSESAAPALCGGP